MPSPRFGRPKRCRHPNLTTRQLRRRRGQCSGGAHVASVRQLRGGCVVSEVSEHQPLAHRPLGRPGFRRMPRSYYRLAPDRGRQRSVQQAPRHRCRQRAYRPTHLIGTVVGQRFHELVSTSWASSHRRTHLSDRVRSGVNAKPRTRLRLASTFRAPRSLSGFRP